MSFLTHFLTLEFRVSHVNLQLIAFGNRGDTCNAEYVEDEQAAVGRLSSMSLMAAVTASGKPPVSILLVCLFFSFVVAVSLQDDIQRAFVKEVERVARDPIYWVRREASFAVGALAKVVSEEIINTSLVGFLNIYHHGSIQIRFVSCQYLFRYDGIECGTFGMPHYSRFPPFFRAFLLQSAAHSP